MLLPLLLAGALLQAVPADSAQTPRAAHETHASATSKDADVDSAGLLKVKRIYVESFGQDIVSKEMQSMIVSALVESKRFKVTEGRERADAFLKGTALETSAQELHSYGEGTAVGQAAMNDTSTHTETTSQAKISIRLVNPDGDVIWTSTQESKGGKYKGSSADVADKCVKQLLRDVEKLESKATSPLGSESSSSTADPAHH